MAVTGGSSLIKPAFFSCYLKIRPLLRLLLYYILSLILDIYVMIFQSKDIIVPTVLHLVLDDTFLCGDILISFNIFNQESNHAFSEGPYI